MALSHEQTADTLSALRTALDAQDAAVAGIEGEGGPPARYFLKLARRTVARLDATAAEAESDDGRAAWWVKTAQELAQQINSTAADAESGTLANVFKLTVTATVRTVANATESAIGGALGFAAGLVPWPVWLAVGVVGVGAAGFFVWRARAAVKALP